MYTQNSNRPQGLTSEQNDNKYFLLYYQFIKNAFGLRHLSRVRGGLAVRVYLDRLPNKNDKVERFREYIAELTNHDDFQRANIKFFRENITEVDSHKHDILQCLDVILGSMQFRLNMRHKEIPVGKKRRAKRTIAKEKVYKHINKRICMLYPNFNIGVSTRAKDVKDRWRHPYRHWLFVPTSHVVDAAATKRARAP